MCILLVHLAQMVLDLNAMSLLTVLVTVRRDLLYIVVEVKERL